ncbi:MAG: hypothetical protein AVDCRST_MAG77-1445, partial [uncultured Chloroflexi bacterium]
DRQLLRRGRPAGGRHHGRARGHRPGRGSRVRGEGGPPRRHLGGGEVSLRLWGQPAGDAAQARRRPAPLSGLPVRPRSAHAGQSSAHRQGRGTVLPRRRPALRLRACWRRCRQPRRRSNRRSFWSRSSPRGPSVRRRRGAPGGL